MSSRNSIVTQALRVRLPMACALAFGAVVICASRAEAQVRGPVSITGPSFALDTPTAYENTPFTPKVEHVLGTWDGILPWLNSHGVGVVIDYTSESAILLDGGHGSDAGYAHQVGAELDIDWGKLIGWQGFRTHAVVVNRAGHNLSADYGDKSLAGIQEIYGGGGNVGVHLVYVYGTQDLAGGRVQIAAGKMPVNIDFSASPLYCTFMTKSICGNPKALTRGAAGFATYPGSVWGGRVRTWPADGFYAQVGVYGANPDLNTNQYDRTGFNFSTNLYTGFYVPAEVGIIPSFGPNHLVGHYKLGVGYDSSPYADWLRDNGGGIAYLTKKPARMDQGKTQLWIEGDQMLIRNGHGPLNGLYAMAGFVRNTPQTSGYRYEFYAGLVGRGVIRARPLDTVGVMFTRTEASPELIALQDLEYGLGRKSLPNSATAPQSWVQVFEATYKFPRHERLRVPAGFPAHHAAQSAAQQA
ncbi:carbohydrate porin [Tanticharoenia sakaeratensis]|uniref:carbohydrate porin n=1 Tax=Tanticharoenia sakaeratensis TaxID=444053 RepID=UPI001F5278B8|nr:carbohydrate porin [Tanticharoenia sakaeratensis]